MRTTTGLRHYAVLFVGFCPIVISHPGPQVPSGGSRNGNAAPAPVVPWVTVDPLGIARTITPTVFTTDGARTTANQPPDSLISTATYTLFPGGTDHPDLASTYTGLAPVASAAGTTNDAGTFLACNLGQVSDKPFCQPKRGSVLYPGRTYYVTWSTTYFQPPDTFIALQVRYPDNTGFTTVPGPASKGFYAWDIPPDFLTSDPQKASLNASLFLVYQNTDTPDDPNDFRQLVGPSVTIAKEPPPPAIARSGGPSVAAIAVPIVLVLVLLGLGSFCFWSWRRHGVVPILGGRRKESGSGSGGGNGVGQSRSQGDGGGGGFGGDDKQEGANVGIQLTDRDSWSPTAGQGASGRNVFREELRRQERQG